MNEKGEVQLVQFIGKSGGFDNTPANRQRLRFKVEIVGLNGASRPGDPSAPYGYAEEVYSMKLASDWAEFTGWPIVRYEEKKREVTERIRLAP